jgi:NAD dependent epimerase/dehydratase
MVNWASKKVLVTGAGGFIGSHLCETLLELGAEVSALIHYNSRNDWGNLEFLPPSSKRALKVVAGNIEDAAFVSRQVKSNQIVFHLAALIAIPYSYHAPMSYVRTNIEGTMNVLEAARTHEVERVVHTSTSETYGTAIYTPIDEKHPLQGQSPYSASKIGADKLAESYYRSFGLPVAVIRPYNTFGPRQSARAVIPTIVTQALTQPEIRLGALDPVRDLNFVKDTVVGFIKVSESTGAIGEVINVGAGKGISIGELAAKILRIMNVDKAVVLDEKRLRPENSEVYRLICDNRKAREKTGWEPQYDFEKGLEATIEFISQHVHLYKPNEYVV